MDKKPTAPKGISDEQIRNAYADCGSAAGAARVLGLNYQSVRYRLIRLGLWHQNQSYKAKQVDAQSYKPRVLAGAKRKGQPVPDYAAEQTKGPPVPCYGTEQSEA